MANDITICGCVFCRGDLPYTFSNGVTLMLNGQGDIQIDIPVFDGYQDPDEPGYFQSVSKVKPQPSMVVDEKKIFDYCPSCGRSLSDKIEEPIPTEQVSSHVWKFNPTSSPVIEVRRPRFLDFLFGRSRTTVRR